MARLLLLNFFFFVILIIGFFLYLFIILNPFIFCYNLDFKQLYKQKPLKNGL